MRLLFGLLVIMLCAVAVGAAPAITLESNSVVQGSKLNASQKSVAVLNLSVSPASTTVYSINEGAYQTLFTNQTQGSVSMSSLSDGVSQIRIVAKENDTSNATKDVTVYVDSASPQAQVSFLPSKTQPGQENVILSWKFSDSTLISSWVALKNPNGTLLRNETSREDNYALLSSTILQGNYTAEYYAIDNFSQTVSGQLTLMVQNSLPEVTLEGPANNTLINTKSVLVKCRAQDANLSTILVYHNNDQEFGAVQEKNANSSETVAFNLTSLDPETFVWNCQAKDALGATAFAQENTTLRVDTVFPQISALSPQDNFVTQDEQVIFQWVVTDNARGTMDCTLWVNGEKKKSVDLDSGNETELKVQFSNGTLEWLVSCIDQAGNNQTSLKRTLTIKKEEEQKLSEPKPEEISLAPTKKEDLPKPVPKPEHVTTKSVNKTQLVQVVPKINETTWSGTARLLGGRFTFKKSMTIASVIILLIIFFLGIMGIKEYSRDNILFRVKVRKYKFLVRQFWETKILRKKNYF